MFASVLSNKTLIFDANMITIEKINPVIHSDIMLLLKTFLNQNYFSFMKTSLVSSKQSLNIDNPLKSLPAEIFMDNLEIQIHKYLLSKLFMFWCRYLDDIFVCFTGTNRQLKLLSNL